MISVADIYAAATSHYRHRECLQAENLCRAILARDTEHLRGLVLLADLVQQSGRNKLAVKMLKRALALDSAVTPPPTTRSPSPIRRWDAVMTRFGISRRRSRSASAAPKC